MLKFGLSIKAWNYCGGILPNQLTKNQLIMKKKNLYHQDDEWTVPSPLFFDDDRFSYHFIVRCIFQRN